MPTRAPFPDYTGSFFYHYGDHPYPDGARAEGLLAAYLLARKTGDTSRMARYYQAIRWAAWATLRLCNTSDSVYSVPDPQRADAGSPLPPPDPAASMRQTSPGQLHRFAASAKSAEAFAWQWFLFHPKTAFGQLVSSSINSCDIAAVICVRQYIKASCFS